MEKQPPKRIPKNSIVRSDAKAEATSLLHRILSEIITKRYIAVKKAELHGNERRLLSIDCRNMTTVVIDSIKNRVVHGFKAAKNFINYGKLEADHVGYFLEYG
ncbi:hypothetical protein YWY31_21800 [Paenibacillus illinoisensis]